MTALEHPKAYKPIKRTMQQMEASDPARSVWVSANAGTGKTYVLIDRITRLLLTGTPANRILCLTFTKAAAAEMANRLHERLGHWAVMDEQSLENDLLYLLGREADEKERTLARHLFAETLDTPEGLKIRTIHSFCESLLARFPLEAGVPPHFSVIDERSQAELLSEAHEDLYANAFADPNGGLSLALHHLAGLIHENDFAELMRNLANSRGKLQILLERHGGIDGTIGYTRSALGLLENETADSVIQSACRDDAFDIAGLKYALKALSQSTGKRDLERAAVIDAWLANPDERPATFLNIYVPKFLTQKMEPTAKSHLLSKKIREADPRVFDVLRTEQDRVHTVIQRRNAYRLLEATRSLLTLGHELAGTFERLKRGRDLLDYDDLILTACRLLNGKNTVPWVHFKLDGGIDHILIDEAQDTSPEQWEIVSALASEFFTGLGAHDNRRTVFAVGDEKQSIFSFQGADPAAFDTMRKYFADKSEQIGERLDALTLALSFRSVECVLTSVDNVFDQSNARDGLIAQDKEIRHAIDRTGEAGLVELWSVEKPDDTPETDPWDAPLDQPSLTSPRVRLAERIADQIQTWLKEKTILESQNRPIEPGDIMILVRRRRPFADEMVRCLKERGIPVAGTDRMILTEQLAVMDMMALGAFALLPEDDLTLATVLKSPLIGFNDQELYDLAYGRKGSLWAELQRRHEEDTSWSEAFEVLNGLLNKADFMPPFEFFSHVLDGLAGRKKMLARLGPDAVDPLDEFMSLALSYEQDHVVSLQGFLHWLETGQTQIKRDLERGHGEVRVMTIHGAKGLQGRIVFLPDTCTVPDARSDSRLLWHHGGESDESLPYLLWAPYREIEETHATRLREEAKLKRDQEYRRLLYVAMTRAEDRLYVCGWEGGRKRSEGCWYNLMAPVIEEKGEPVSLPDGREAWRITSKQTADISPAKAHTPANDVPSLPAWALRPPAPEPEPSAPLTPSRQTDDEPAVRSPFGEDDGARFKRGRIIHTLLQTLPELALDRREAAAQSFLAEPRHGLDEAAQTEIRRETMKILKHPDFAFLFAPNSLAEVPLVAEIGGAVIAGQVDRLVITDQAVAVVDYKTNRPPPTMPEDVAPVYLRQMAAYQTALAKIYPGRSIQSYLLWTDGPTLMPLNAERLAAFAP